MSRRSPDSSLVILLADLESRLKPISETPRLDSQVLLAHILGQPRSWLLAHPEAYLSSQQYKQLEEATARLESGVPLPYILGHWEFYGLDFLVNPDVLIPRPETEILVEHAIHWLYENPKSRYVADVATGSGCIAVSLAIKVPDLHLLATDISLPALQIADMNARKHNVADRIVFVQADLLDFSPSTPFNLICANLPYIPTASLSKLAVAEQEPRIALDGGIKGLDLIKRLLNQARGRLASESLMLLEIEASQGLQAQNLARQAFENAQIKVYPDLAGRDRLLEVRFPA